MISKCRRDAVIMGQGSADETIVAIKPVADENMVTYLRVKLRVSSRTVKAKGGTCNRNCNNRIRTVNLRQGKKKNSPADEEAYL